MQNFKILIASVLLFRVMDYCCADFADDCLNAHNLKRKMHGVPPLKLDPVLNKVAQDYAQFLARTGKFRHSDTNYGENLFLSKNKKGLQAQIAVDSWYKEIKDYKPQDAGNNWQITGHFTQLVWKNSKRLGCATAKSGNRDYVVANYDPPGNWVGQYHENVLPLKRA